MEFKDENGGGPPCGFRNLQRPAIVRSIACPAKLVRGELAENLGSRSRAWKLGGAAISGRRNWSLREQRLAHFPSDQRVVRLRVSSNQARDRLYS